MSVWKVSVWLDRQDRPLNEFAIATRQSALQVALQHSPLYHGGWTTVLTGPDGEEETYGRREDLLDAMEATHAEVSALPEEET